MCLKDNRVWQRIVARQTAAIVGGGTTLIAPPAPFRVGIRFGNDLSAASVIGPDPAVTAASGIIIDNTGAFGFVAVYWDDWGGAIQMPWFAANAGAASTLSVTELLLAPEDWDYFTGFSDVANLPRRP